MIREVVMATLTLTDEQVLQLIEQLPAGRKAEVLLRLAKDAAEVREENLRIGEERLKQIAKQRGLNWEAMSEEQRLDLVDDLMHEDRKCG
jgi:hypothetical protein